MITTAVMDLAYTVEPPNKGHVGDNKISAVLSFVERLSSFGGSKCIRAIYKDNNFWDLNLCSL